MKLKEVSKGVSSDELSPVTTDTIDVAKRILKQKGWKYKATKRSASIEWRWTKGSEEFTLTGWHGLEPKKWGVGKIIHDMYYSVDRKNKSTILVIDPDKVKGNVTLSDKKQYENNLKKVLNFVREYLK